MQSKKATVSFATIRVVVSVVLTIIVLVSFYLLTARYTTIDQDVFGIESTILVNSFFYARGGLSYEDPITNRIYPNIVELQKFYPGDDANKTQEQLLSSIYFGQGQRHIAAKITISGYSVYYNKPNYGAWEPLTTQTKAVGPSQVFSKNFTKDLLVKESDGSLKQETATITVLKQKT